MKKRLISLSLSLVLALGLAVPAGAALVSCGTWTTLAVKTDGTLWPWGYDVSGVLGTDGKGDLADENGYAIQSVPAELAGLKVRMP